VTASVLNEHEASVLNTFYHKYPYPWPTRVLTKLDDPAFHARLLCQDVGDRTHSRVPADATIWVAGCGTNQALITALAYPEATVLGTDAAGRTLELCEANAKQFGIKNLTLRHEGIAQATYRNQFDYVICTGAIHHNPDPAALLARLSAAMRPDSVLELMIYNVFHRREMVAYQAALRLMGVYEIDPLSKRLAAARSIAESLPADGSIRRKMDQFEYMGDEGWADSFMNLLERSFSVETMWQMAEGCGLTVEAPVVNSFDQVNNSYLWDVPMRDPEGRARYERLPDRERWQVTNLLLLDQSPMLWFYLSPAARGRVTEAERDEMFLDTAFRHNSARLRRWLLDEKGGWHEDPSIAPFPGALPSQSVRPVFEAVDGRRTMRDIMAGHGASSVRAARIHLTSSQFPFLTPID
jgi:SAM-dependent methyltransferase